LPAVWHRLNRAVQDSVKPLEQVHLGEDVKDIAKDPIEMFLQRSDFATGRHIHNAVMAIRLSEETQVTPSNTTIEKLVRHQSTALM
jgi:hypothetical protein